MLAVLTLAHGRHDHLRGQIHGLAAGTRRPDLHVVVAMDDHDLEAVARDAWAEAAPHEEPPLTVAHLDHDPRGLPLASARNLAAQVAIDAGAQHLVFLDVDCIPGATAISGYHEQLIAVPAPTAPALLCGDVAYLPPLPAGQTDWTESLDRLAESGEHRPDRVRLEPGGRQPEPDLMRFWSLSFALSSADFTSIGGFCPDYVGYGGEDTDFAVLVGERGGSLTWVGGATAYHQHHRSTSPPVQHLDAVVRNAGVFERRWGRWPMLGWLEQFRELGLAAPDDTGRWVVTR